MAITHTIPVEAGAAPYEVAVGTDLLDGLGEVLAHLTGQDGGGRAAVITDSNVGPLYAAEAAGALATAGFRTDAISFPAGEASKNLATYGRVMDELLALDPPIDRRGFVVALGGGVVGDLAGFVAATALRGVRFVNVPTSLLAAVDASVGGKTGLDSPAGKNLIGAFHQPSAVVIDADLLKTLPPAELLSGLAECVKHAVIRDAGLLDLIEADAPAILKADAEVLAELIASNVAIKARVVAADERESGQRAHLNFGHTLGHALEAAAGFGGISHGQAVALGMVAACRIAVARSLLAPADADRVEGILRSLHLPVRFADAPGLAGARLDADNLRRLIARDKKALAGVPRFVLPTRLGAVDVFSDVTADQIDRAIRSLAG